MAYGGKDKRRVPSAGKEGEENSKWLEVCKPKREHFAGCPAIQIYAIVAKYGVGCVSLSVLQCSIPSFLCIWLVEGYLFGGGHKGCGLLIGFRILLREWFLIGAKPPFSIILELFLSYLGVFFHKFFSVSNKMVLMYTS